MDDPKRECLSYRIKLQLHSEYWTNLVFQWFKCDPMGNVGLPNGPHPGLGPSAETRARILLILAIWTQFQHFKQLRTPPPPYLVSHLYFWGTRRGSGNIEFLRYRKKSFQRLVSSLWPSRPHHSYVAISLQKLVAVVQYSSPVLKPCQKAINQIRL